MNTEMENGTQMTLEEYMPETYPERIAGASDSHALQRELIFLQTKDTCQLKMFLSEMKSLHTKGDGEKLFPQCVETEQSCGKSMDLEFSQPSQQQSIHIMSLSKMVSYISDKSKISEKTITPQWFLPDEQSNEYTKEVWWIIGRYLADGWLVKRKDRPNGGRIVFAVSDRKREEFEKLGKTKASKEQFTTVMLMNDNDSKRRINELCMQKNKMVVNPIIDWKDSDIWEFIQSEHLNVCELYQCGYNRVGCIGCPMAGKKRYKGFADFPKYKNLYIHAFDRMIQERKRRGLPCKWDNGNEVFLWWMEDENIAGQMELSDFIEM